MKNTPGEHAVPQPGRLTPDQYHALGEIWSFLLHLWYSEPSNPTSSSSHATASPGKARSLTLNRRKSSFGPLSLLIKNDSDNNNNNNNTNNNTNNNHNNHNQHPLVTRPAKSHTIGHGHGASTSEGGYSSGNNTHASEGGEFSPTSPQPNSYYYQHHHQRSCSASSGSQAPASPTRLSQSFRQPSLASSSPRSNNNNINNITNNSNNNPMISNSLYTGLGIGSGMSHSDSMPSISSLAHPGNSCVSFAATMPVVAPSASLMSPNGGGSTGGGGGGGNGSSSSYHSSHSHPSQLNQQLNDKTAAAVAALRRSAARLKGWVPSKKFTFKYSPTAYHDAFWNFVQNEHPDSVVLRFLKARKWNVERAMEMLVLALEWRISNKLDELAVEDEETLDCKYPGFLYLLKRGKVAFPGQDLEGRPLLFVNPTLDDQNLHLACRRVILYAIEHTRMRLRPPNDRTSVVVDLSTLSMSDVDLNSVKFIVHAVDNCYTETMGVGVLYKAPWLFGRLWKVVSPLMDPSSRNRLKFASTRKELEEAVGTDCPAYLKPGKGLSPHEAAAALQAESSFLHSKDVIRKSKEKEIKESKDQEKESHSSGGFHFGKDKDKDKDDDEPPTHFDFPYIPPTPGENDLFYQNSETKHRVITRRKELELTFERLTEVWQGQRELSSASTVIQERDAVGYKLTDAFWQAEPYTRVRTVFHRAGAIKAPEPFFFASTTTAIANITTTNTTTTPSTTMMNGSSMGGSPSIFPHMPGRTLTMMSGQSTTVAPFSSSGPPSFGSLMGHESSSPGSSPIAACL
ncbi:hypothetical protein DFQ27_002044 [Actinomortierella ambigua]|uniref:CRAL-TRIO domain-containing protein n=1 Tax=Actinomortierella ambigua TaxID=1343610 RepID=A0A9P6QBX6_9FUNG|nr:hypothetical protein DFQ27_002044 [Actinomortierella ambigua]